MSKQSINFEVEAALVSEVDVVLKELGISMPEAITTYLEQIVINHSIPLHKTTSQEESLATPKIWIDEAVESYLEWF